MGTTVATPARSLHGCWTCRVRRKKCDETHPFCSRCISFGLECHGYGPRPEWMHDEISQKEQALKFKQMVSQTKTKKGRRSNRGSNIPEAGKETSPNAPLTTSERPLNEWSGTIGEHGFYYQMNGADSISSIDPAWSASSHHDSLAAECGHFYNRLGFAPAPTFPKASLSPDSSEWLSAMANDLPDVRQPDATTWDEVVPQEGIGFTPNGRPLSNYGGLICHSSESNALSEESSSNHQANFKFTTQGQTLTVPGSYEQPTPWPMASSELIPGGGAEDALFMHYLDQVFYFQFPFYQSCNGRGRGWLFSILRRVKPAYYATLALSERDLLSMQPQSSNVTSSLAQLRAKGGYYNLAVQGMQRIMDSLHIWNGHTHLVHSLEGLTTILQLFFWELFAGGTSNWQALLHTAAGLIPPLLQTRMPHSMSSLATETHTIKQLHKRTPYPEDDSATDVLLGSFISFDILSCASTRGTPLLELDHVQALANLGISLESLMGCRSSVMALISDISSLDRWKKESHAARKLSIVDLAKRGGLIEDRLQQELASIKSVTSATGPPASSHSGIHSATAHPEVSQLFALSAITYLHVVISGAHPELPEIAQTISRTIDVFNRLSEPKLLRSVVWPLCVSGSLALEEHHSFFRDLCSAAEINKYSTGTCFEALNIMEECWEARKTGSYSCDWASIMNKRDRYVLLR